MNELRRNQDRGTSQESDIASKELNELKNALRQKHENDVEQFGNEKKKSALLFGEVRIFAVLL